MEENLKAFALAVVPSSNVLMSNVSYKGVTFSCMKVGYNKPDTKYYFWDSTGTISLHSFSYPRETEFSEELVKELYSIFESSINNIVCCCVCHKHLFNKVTYEKINNWHQVWAGFYCDEHYDGSVMDTSGD